MIMEWYSKSNGVVGIAILSYEIFSMLDGKDLLGGHLPPMFQITNVNNKCVNMCNNVLSNVTLTVTLALTIVFRVIWYFISLW